MKQSEARLADLISAHLAWLEADPVFNAPRMAFGIPTRPLVGSWARVSARRTGGQVLVTYLCFQGPYFLTTEQAQAYLDWLDAGNKGTHLQMQRQVGKG